MTLVIVFAAPHHIPSPLKDFSSWLTIMGISLILTYTVASLSWYYLEKPILDFTHQKLKHAK